jgi:hypothetical protein
MTTRAVYIVVLGVLALAGILSAAFASKLDNNTQVITGVLVVAGVAVGALATMARDFHEIRINPQVEVRGARTYTEPQGGWPEHGWPPADQETRPNPTVGE